MYNRRHNLIIGFHGCDESVRDKIVKGEDIQILSKNDYDWLGHGYYFWENNYARALDYAKYLKEHPKHGKGEIKVPSVLGAVIELGNCLDLLDQNSLSVVKDAYVFLRKAAKKAGYTLPKNTNIPNGKDRIIRRLDCAVIQIVHNISKEEGIVFDSVRNVFVEGRALYRGAGFKSKSHIQICVRNPNCIKGYFIPRESSNDWVKNFQD